MKKEVLTLSNIRQDLSRIPRFYRYYSIEWRYIYVFLFTPIAILSGLLFKSLWVGLLVFLAVAAYHVVRFVMTCIRCAAQKKAIKNACEHGELSISVQRLHHIVTEKIYEPNLGVNVRIHFFKEVYILELDSLHWRVPGDFMHYEWSEEYCVGPGVLINTAVRDAEFICVTVKDHPDISYVYPCQFFVLDKSLRYAVEEES